MLTHFVVNVKLKAQDI